MKILFLTHRLPYPPDKGERIRSYHVLKYLASRYEIDLFCLADHRDELGQLKGLTPLCRRTHVEVPGKPGRLVHSLQNFLMAKPVTFGFFRSAPLRRAVETALRNNSYDLIVVNCSSMVQFVPQHLTVPMVVDFVDADSHKFRQYAAGSHGLARWFMGREARLVNAAEREIGRRASYSMAVTRHDAFELQASGWDGPEVQVVSMGVDLPEIEEICGDFRELQPYALFVGTMSYRPNVDAAIYFATEILPLIRQNFPNLKFVIVGRDPHSRIRKLARLKDVVVTGKVADVFCYFKSAMVSIASFRMSQGFHSKIAESLAVGTPVVATRRAADGIGLSEREGLFRAEGRDEFAKAVVRILGDEKLCTDLRARAALVRQQLTWDERLKGLDESLQALVGAQLSSVATGRV